MRCNFSMTHYNTGFSMKFWIINSLVYAKKFFTKFQSLWAFSPNKLLNCREFPMFFTSSYLMSLLKFNITKQSIRKIEGIVIFHLDMLNAKTKLILSSLFEGKNCRGECTYFQERMENLPEPSVFVFINGRQYFGLKWIYSTYFVILVMVL